MSFRQLFVSLTLIVSLNAHAATEFENGLAPVELVRQFSGGSIHRSLPDGFPLVTLPANLNARLVGSMQRGTTREVLLSTTQSLDALRGTLVAAYVAGGWTDLTPAGLPGLSRLCHDQLGSLFFANAQLDYHGLRITSTPPSSPGGLSCRDQAAQNGQSWDTYFISLLPALKAPAQTTTPEFLAFPFISMSGQYNTSGSGAESKREGEIHVPDINVAGLYAHYAARMAEKGWTNDSEDAGALSASSVWYATAPPPDFAADDVTDTQLTGILTILALGDNKFRVMLSVRVKTNAVITTGLWSFSRDYVPLERGILTDPQIGIRGIPSGYVPR